jgi:tryptophan synthase beta chain
MGPDAVIVINLSGRGDKDVDTAAKWFGMISGDESAEDASGTAIAEASLAEPGAAAPEERPSGESTVTTDAEGVQR